MRTVAKTLIPLVALLVLGACDGRVERTDGGGVVLSVSDFDGLPTQALVSELRAAGILTIDSITIQSIVKDINGASSDLMNVEMTSYEVAYSRGDGGTIVPPPLVNKIFGVTPAGGDTQYENLPILTLDQIEARPLEDLFFENGGVDRETGRSRLNLNFRVRFFGRSIAGEAVETLPVHFTVVFFP